MQYGQMMPQQQPMYGQPAMGGMMQQAATTTTTTTTANQMAMGGMPMQQPGMMPQQPMYG